MGFFVRRIPRAAAGPSIGMVLDKVSNAAGIFTETAVELRPRNAPRRFRVHSAASGCSLRRVSQP